MKEKSSDEAKGLGPLVSTEATRILRDRISPRTSLSAGTSKSSWSISL